MSSEPNNPEQESSNQSIIVSNTFEPQVLSRIADLLIKFIKLSELQIDFFETQGNKVDDYLDFLVLMYFKFSPTDAIDICQLYSKAFEIIASKNIATDNCRRFVFLSHVVKFFGQKAILHLMANIQNILNTYYQLIIEVSNENPSSEIISSVFKYAVGSLILSMNNEVQIAGVVASWIQQNTDQKWSQQIPVDEPFLMFIKYIEWPLITNEDGASFIIGTIIALLVNNEMDPKHELVITEAAVYQALSLKGYPDDPILNYSSVLDNEKLTTSPNMRAIATFAFYSLLSNNTQIINSKSFATLVRLLANGIEFSPALLVCERFLKDVVKSGSSKESAHFNYLSLVLRSAVLNLPRLDAKDKEIITSILETFYNVDHNETFKIINQFLREQKCPKDLLQVFINFAVNKDIDLQFFVPHEPSHTAIFAKTLVVGARAAFTDHTFYNILLFLQACMKVLANPNTDLSQSTDGLSVVIPYAKIHRLCYYCLYIPNNPKLRLLAYDILSETGIVFEKEHPDWESLDISEQALIRQIDAELKSFIKQDCPRIKKPRQLMVLEMERFKALNFVSRKISTTRIKFSAKMLKESVDLGEKMGCVYLFNMTACMINPVLLYDAGKYAVQPLLLCTKLTKVDHFSPLQYLDFEYFGQIMERLSGEPTVKFIPAIEAMSICAVNNIDKVKIDTINMQMSILETLIKENPSLSNQMHLLAKTLDNISQQIVKCEGITSFPPFMEKCQTMLLDNAKVERPEISDTLLSTLLAQLRFETPIDTILSVLRLQTTYDSPATPIFFQKLTQYYPDKFLEIMNYAYRILPDMIASILMENPIEDKNFFTLFCYFISDKTAPHIVSALKKFISSQYPQISLDGVTTDKIAGLFLQKVDGLADSMLKYSIEFYNSQEQNAETHLRLLDILIPSAKYISNPDELIEFGLKLTRDLLIASDRFDEFWKTMTNSKSSTKQVFDIFIRNGVEPFIVDYVYNLCVKKEALIRYAQKLIFTDFTKYVSNCQISSLLTLYNIAIKGEELTASTLISTCILIEMIPSDCLLAYKYIKPILSPNEIPKDQNLLLNMLIHQCKEEVSVILKSIKRMILSCTTIAPIHYLLLIVFFYALSYPEKVSASIINKHGDSPLVNKAFLAILKSKEAQKDIHAIDVYLGEFYRKIGRIIRKFDFPIDTISYLLDIGFLFKDVDLKKLNYGFLEFILSLQSKKYFSKHANSNQLNNLAMFMLYGDEMLVEISTIFTKKIIEKVNNKVSNYWINAVLNANETIIEDEEIFDSMKKALIFGGEMNVVLISRILRNTAKNKSDEIPKMIIDFVKFLMVSKEVNKKNALNLIKIIDEVYGEVKELERPESVKAYKRNIAELAKYFKASK
ncbi:hypothetical protein GPJ56_008373 [Histomonas meleagridis]|uniref:uncharacterized protein n=1 Tax=Histomonas meleagridis TaxID=135588 RepID=UPI003559D42E|nr:hypothetical protein GPJ56_008373 [Histomonas meleagridis]KAH0798909.1 hypothetical protein GO595_008300 [Histomonas meleagridis]